MADNPNFYRQMADQERRNADSSMLDQVKERCLRAEAAWIAMAERAEKIRAQRIEREQERSEAAATV